MNTIKAAFLAGGALACLGLGCTGSAPDSIRVGSYNIRNMKGDKGTVNDWDDRKGDLVDQILRLDMDVFGMQEVFPEQLDYIRSRMPEWEFVGDFRNADRVSGEASPVGYRKSRFEPLGKGTFWLSETPDVPGSKSWHTACTRVCSYLILKDRTNGAKFCFANTHTDHRSAEAREKGMLLILERMKEFGEGAPIVFVGDHNCTYASAPATAVRRHLKDARNISAAKDPGPVNTFHRWGALKDNPDYRIDYIYVSDGVEVVDFVTHDERRPGKDLLFSDHYPITATIRLPDAAPARAADAGGYSLERVSEGEAYVIDGGARIARIALGKGQSVGSFATDDGLVVRVRGDGCRTAVNLLGLGGETVTNHLLKVAATLFVPDVTRGFREDETVNLCHRRWDFRLWREVGPEPLDACVVPDMPVGTMRRIANLQVPGGSRSLEVSSTLRCLNMRTDAESASLEFRATDCEAPSGIEAVTDYRFGRHRTLAFASPFTDGAILQREMPVAVWGTADTNAEVKVSFAGRTVTAKADSQGKWKVRLPSMAASKAGRTLVAESAGARVEVRDVRVGEVWIAAGQSNMEVPVHGMRTRFRDAQGELIAGMIRKDECLRFAHAATYTWSVKPLEEICLTWAPICRDYLMSHLYASAVGTYFARELFATLDVPVAVIGAYWGGTGIEPWTPQKKPVGDPNRKRAGHAQPGALFNACLAPIAPYTVRGMIWYQGENNARKPEGYAKKMHEFYKGISGAFENPKFALVFAQIAPYADKKGKNGPAVLRLEQARFADEEPNARMAVLADVGNPTDIHPNDKRTVARRFAALALRHWYGFDRLIADSPKLNAAVADGEKVSLSFEGNGRFYSYSPDRSPAKGFELCGADGVWHPATVVNEGKGGMFSGEGIVLSAEGVAAPSRVRYLCTAPYLGTVFGAGGLPLGCFDAAVGVGR